MRLNIALITFILIAFSGFKFLYLQEQIPEGEVDDCEFTAVQILQCIKSIGVNCKDANGDFVFFINTTVCLNFAEFTEADGNCEVGEHLEPIDDLAECITLIGSMTIALVKAVLSLIFILLAVIYDLLIIVTFYLLLSFSTIPGAPFIINFIVVTPLVILNLIMVIGLLPGGAGDD